MTQNFFLRIKEYQFWPVSLNTQAWTRCAMVDIENSSARLTILVGTKLEFELGIHNSNLLEIEILL